MMQAKNGPTRTNPDEAHRGPMKIVSCLRSGSDACLIVFAYVYICLHVFVSKKIHKRKLTGSSAQNIFGDPRYSQVSPWVSVGFPGKKRSIGLRCRPPHACIHLEKFMYPLALVSCAPTNNTFPASGTHTCLILRGYPPLVPIHFWQKVRGLTPPLCSYIIRNVGSTPPTPEPVGVGMIRPCVVRSWKST